jgi:tetratricopeptide (TPR) repeat protein
LNSEAFFHQDKTAYERGLAFLARIDPTILNPKGKTDLTYYQGRLNLLTGNAAKAAECYTEALQLGAEVLPLIYRLEALVRTGDLENAKADLEALRSMDIPSGSRLEFLRSAADYAVSVQDLQMVRALAHELKAFDPGMMHFRSQRDSLRAALLEFIDDERSKGDAKIKLPRYQAILTKIRALSEYLELKPNFCGLGPKP